MARSPASAPTARARSASTRWVGSAFGLRLDADLPVLGLAPHDAGLEAPTTRVRRTAPETIDAEWPTTEAERVSESRYRDGSVLMTVDAHPGRGYRVEAPGYGRFRVSADGSLVECAPAAESAWRWHRPFISQALPLAAAMAGRHLLHASAVVVDGRAVAFTGHSGAGKTSLALHLIDGGAALLADDVVALSATSEQLYAHPGVRFANVAEEQLESVAPDRRGRLGRVIGRSEQLHILIDSLASTPAPLGALYFLERGPAVGQLEFERLWPPDLSQVLAASYIRHVSVPARMAEQLEMCALIADQVAMFHLMVPASLGAAELAPLVAAHARQA